MAQAMARLEGAFAIANAQLGRTKSDKPYLRCLLGDNTGQLPGRMWSIDEHTYRRLPTDGFVPVEGETQPYQGELQLIIHQIDPLDPTPDQLRELLPSAERHPDEMFAELTALLETLKELLPAGTRLVANAVTMEAEILLADLHAERGGDLLRLELSSAMALGNKRGWVAAYPIVQWSGLLRLSRALDFAAK